MRYVVDIETTSACDLPSCGAEKYARDPSTLILCIAWDDADSPFPGGPKLWRCDRSPGLRDVFNVIPSIGPTFLYKSIYPIVL